MILSSKSAMMRLVVLALLAIICNVVADQTTALHISITRQFPPPARVNEVYSWSFSNDTFTSDLPINLSFTINDNSTWLGLNSSSRTFYGTPSDNDTGTPDIKLIATDSDGDTAAETFTFLVTNKPAPVLTFPLSVQVSNTSLGPAAVCSSSSIHLYPNQHFEWQLANNTFTSPDSQIILYALQTTSDPLPYWLSFSREQRTFRGTAPSGNVSYTIGIKVVASEANNPQYIGGPSDTFQLVINDHTPMPIPPSSISSSPAPSQTASNASFVPQMHESPPNRSLLYAVIATSIIAALALFGLFLLMVRHYLRKQSQKPVPQMVFMASPSKSRRHSRQSSQLYQPPSFRPSYLLSEDGHPESGERVDRIMTPSDRIRRAYIERHGMTLNPPRPTQPPESNPVAIAHIFGSGDPTWSAWGSSASPTDHLNASSILSLSAFPQPPRDAAHTRHGVADVSLRVPLDFIDTKTHARKDSAESDSSIEEVCEKRRSKGKRPMSWRPKSWLIHQRALEEMGIVPPTEPTAVYWYKYSNDDLVGSKRSSSERSASLQTDGGTTESIKTASSDSFGGFIDPSGRKVYLSHGGTVVPGDRSGTNLNGLKKLLENQPLMEEVGSSKPPLRHKKAFSKSDVVECKLVDFDKAKPVSPTLPAQTWEVGQAKIVSASQEDLNVIKPIGKPTISLITDPSKIATPSKSNEVGSPKARSAANVFAPRFHDTPTPLLKSHQGAKVLEIPKMPKLADYSRDKNPFLTVERGEPFHHSIDVDRDEFQAASKYTQLIARTHPDQGPLPAWLRFESESLEFWGIPFVTSEVRYVVQIIQRWPGGDFGDEHVVAQFTLEVRLPEQQDQSSRKSLEEEEYAIISF